VIIIYTSTLYVVLNMFLFFSEN